jgi:hypothetical protein
VFPFYCYATLWKVTLLRCAHKGRLENLWQVFLFIFKVILVIEKDSLQV